MCPSRPGRPTRGRRNRFDVGTVLTGRSRNRYRQSLIALPAVYVAGALALGVIAPELDAARNRGGADLGTARDVLTATATGMIAFTGFVLAGLLVVVQFAAGQYSPRLVLWFRRDHLIKHSIGVFLAAFLYALVALRRLDEPGSRVSPDITVGIALALLVASSVIFLVLLQRVTDRLRPRTLFAAVTREAMSSARTTYPARLGEENMPDPATWRHREPQVVRHAGRPGVVASVERAQLMLAAERADAVIEVIPAVGEFIARDQVLLHIHGGSISPETLADRVVITDERTIEQDPAFAIRIIVDVAIRALSPAINDPTTAVHALDELEVLLRELAACDLEATLTRDRTGAPRLVWNAPGWENLLSLAFDEIRGYGADSIQVCRRLLATLEDLLETSAASRRPGVEEHLARLQAQTLRSFPEDSPERALAQVPDRTGLGLGQR